MLNITTISQKVTAAAVSRINHSQSYKWLRNATRPMALLLVMCLALPLVIMLTNFERAASAQTISFTTHVEFNVPGAPTSVTTADFNGDGKLDIAEASFVGSVSVLLNTTTPGGSSPTFTAATSFTTGTQPRCVVAGDFNGD